MHVLSCMLKSTSQHYRSSMGSSRQSMEVSQHPRKTLKCPSRRPESYTPEDLKKACLGRFRLYWKIKAIIPNINLKLDRTVQKFLGFFSIIHCIPFERFCKSMRSFAVFFVKCKEIRSGSRLWHSTVDVRFLFSERWHV